MLKVADAIKSIFTLNSKVSTLSIKHVLKYLEDQQRGFFNTKQELIESLEAISQIYPGFIEIKKDPIGYRVKIKRSQSSHAGLRQKLLQL